MKDFAPEVADYSVQAIAAAPDGNGVAIGGSFSSVNGSSEPGYGMAILENDGSVRNNAINSVVKNAGNKAAIMSLRADSQGLYGTAYSMNSRLGNIEGMFRADWTTGELAYLADCHGDTYDVQPMAMSSTPPATRTTAPTSAGCPTALRRSTTPSPSRTRPPARFCRTRPPATPTTRASRLPRTSTSTPSSTRAASPA